MPRITESIGNIFDAPPNSVLIHACNCQGSWGAGVALEFKKRYPEAYTVYNAECNTPPSPFHHRSLLGTSLLIPPQDEDLPSPSSRGHWIACLFTSLHYGAKKSSPDVMLEMTKKAMGDLAKKLKFTRGRGQEVGELWCVRLNSGLFGVRWERTKRVLEQCGMDLHVVGPEEEAVGVGRGVENGKSGGERDGGRDGEREKAEAEAGSTTVESRAEDLRKGIEGPVAVGDQPVAAGAEPSTKRKKSKSEHQAPEMGSEPTNAAASAALSSVPPQPEKHKKHKKSTREPEPGEPVTTIDRPKADDRVDPSARTDKKRRRRDGRAGEKAEAEAEAEAEGKAEGKAVPVQDQEMKKKRKKGKMERGAE